MKDKHFLILTMALIVGLATLAGFMLVNMTTEWSEKDEYCELNGYQKVSSYSTIIIDGKKYLECYKNEVRFGKLVETEDWLVFKGDNGK